MSQIYGKQREDKRRIFFFMESVLDAVYGEGMPEIMHPWAEASPPVTDPGSMQQVQQPLVDGLRGIGDVIVS